MLSNRKIPDIFLGALLAVAIFSLGASVAFSLYQPQKNEAAQGAKNSDNLTGSDDRIAEYTLAQVWLNVFLVVSTIGLWWQTRKSSQISERALLSLERPYIFPVDPIFVRTATELYAEFIVANCGRAPGDIREVNAQFFPDEILPTVPPYALGEKTTDLDVTCIPLSMVTEGMNPRVPLLRASTGNLGSKYFFGYYSMMALSRSKGVALASPRLVPTPNYRGNN
jgi:hypothetical protein